MASLNSAVQAVVLTLVAASCSPDSLKRDESSSISASAIAKPDKIPEVRNVEIPTVKVLTIPQYRRVRPPSGSVELDLGLRGILSFREGCVVVIDDAKAVVVPIFPIGVRWVDSGKAIQFGPNRLKDGDQIEWNVQIVSKNFQGDGSLQPGEEPVPSVCAGDRFVRVLD